MNDNTSIFLLLVPFLWLVCCLISFVFNNSIHAHRVNFERDSLLSNIALSKQPMKKLKGCMGLYYLLQY